jgi:hypothetical protein
MLESGNLPRPKRNKRASMESVSEFEMQLKAQLVIEVLRSRKEDYMYETTVLQDAEFIFRYVTGKIKVDPPSENRKD